MIGGLIFWIVLCFVVGYVAGEKNRDPMLWGFLSALISPLIGFIVLMAIGDKEEQPS